VNSAGPGQGSEFVLKLPLVNAEPERTEESGKHARPRRASPSGIRILVVDDNRDAALSLATLLRLQGHDVQMANDGRSAIEVARSIRPNVIFLDLGMPEMDGFEVARAICRVPELSQAKLVALTGWGQPEDRRRTAEAGFIHHLVKPVELRAIDELMTTFSRTSAEA